MFSNIIILFPLLISITYLGFYLRKNWITRVTDSSQDTISIIEQSILLTENQAIIVEEVDIVSPPVIKPEEKKQNSEVKKRFKGIKLGILIPSYLSLLIGMLSIIVYRDLKQYGFVNVEKFRIDILLTVMVSPIVFQAMLTNNPNLSKLQWYYLVLLGYQNGFFWQTIFGEVIGKA